MGVVGWVITRFWLPPVEDLIKRVGAQRSPACRVLLLGESGVGKTSLIERWLTGRSTPTLSTSDFRVWDHGVRVQLEPGHTVPVTIADYRGQAISQIVTEARAFTQPNGHKAVNAVLFIVDLYREITDDRGQTLSDDDATEWILKENLDVDDRVARNNDYFDEHKLQLFFSEFCNPPKPDPDSNRHIVSVQLLINKVDLLKRLAARDLPSLKPGYEQIALGAYSRLAGQLRERCVANGIDPSQFEVRLVSARAGEPGEDIPMNIAKSYRRFKGGSE